MDVFKIIIIVVLIIVLKFIYKKFFNKKKVRFNLNKNEIHLI